MCKRKLTLRLIAAIAIYISAFGAAMVLGGITGRIAEYNLTTDNSDFVFREWILWGLAIFTGCWTFAGPALLIMWAMKVTPSEELGFHE